jgi:XTP/dITP diphosphohydrolase
VRLVLATANPGKVAEIDALLDGAQGVELVPRPKGVPEPVEDGDTLLDNARIKARAIVAVTGQAAIADDTGLEVDALGGRPGVATAHFAGPEALADDNIQRLLSELAGVASEHRSARWRTVALVVHPDGTEVAAEGVCEGWITEAPRGDGGFGYDPVFAPAEGDGRAFAEMTRAEKNQVSHRAKAFHALADHLRA